MLLEQILYLLVEYFCVDLASHSEIKLKFSLCISILQLNQYETEMLFHIFLLFFPVTVSVLQTTPVIILKRLCLWNTRSERRKKKTMKKFRFIMNTKMKNGQMTLLKTLLSMEILLRTNNVHETVSHLSDEKKGEKNRRNL